MSDKIFDIGIIGYGPVGATLSGLLSSLGLSVVLIEKNEGVSPTARAINTDSEQLRTFNFLNIASKIISNSRKVCRVHFTDSEFVKKVAKGVVVIVIILMALISLE